MASSEIVDVWRIVSPLIDDVLVHSDGKFDKRYVFDALQSGKAQLWLAPRCMLITRVLHYPKKRVLELFMCAGEDLAEYLDEGLRALEAYGRERGCDLMEIWGRKGWQRMLADYGFESKLYIVRKTL